MFYFPAELALRWYGCGLVHYNQRGELGSNRRCSPINILIVYAHPDSASFAGVLKDETIKTLEDMDYRVQISNLYAMHFNAVARPGDFTSPKVSEHFDLHQEQAHAVRYGGFVPQIGQEQDKLLWADYIIFQFPLWWYSMPAILKGWVDRVLAYGFAYGEGRSLVGRRAMLVVTTGGPTRIYTTELRQAMTELLDPIHYNILYVCGMQVLPPFVVYGAANATQEEREIYIQQYRQTLEVLNRILPLDYSRRKRIRGQD